MNNKVTTVYMWKEKDDPEEVDVTIQRRGVGFREHTYHNVGEASQFRLLNVTPPKPTDIIGNMLTYVIRI